MNSYLISRIRHHGSRASYIFGLQLALFTPLGVTAQVVAQFDSVQVDNVLSVDELQVTSVSPSKSSPYSAWFDCFILCE